MLFSVHFICICGLWEYMDGITAIQLSPYFLKPNWYRPYSYTCFQCDHRIPQYKCKYVKMPLCVNLSVWYVSVSLCVHVWVDTFLMCILLSTTFNMYWKTVNTTTFFQCKVIHNQCNIAEFLKFLVQAFFFTIL